jgi:hypothetical protein
MCYISIQRHRAIVKPLQTMGNAQRSTNRQLFAIFMAALLFNVPVWFEFTWSVVEVRTEDDEYRWFLWHTASNLAMNPTYKLIVSGFCRI